MRNQNRKDRVKFTGKTECNIGIKGSFMIAAIGSDGIIVASETRGNIFDLRDKKETPIAYFDGVQKEFIIGKTVLASTGKGAIGNVFFSAFINDFKSNLINYPPVDIFFNVLSDYYKQKIPQSLHHEIESNLMLVAGFKDGQPMICYFQNSEINCIQNDGFIESAATFFQDKYSKNHSCDVLGKMAIDAIKDYSKQNDNWKTIGDEVSVIKITKENEPIWLNKIDFIKWIYITDLIDEYNEGDFQISLIPPFSKKDLENVFENK
ncbi:MAG: hypothetical protein RBS73_01895 [Prolixibacteraceae bacterium]|nr:hypothetical protein [Prolixibacteraceae bacterium]